mmetsp:Transcript_43690/g.107216  ORF Transcript_43690/g.107216 Transcript_43690/m.107216 type:complete len:418 (-) Transcript_43690:88-1341(-)
MKAMSLGVTSMAGFVLPELSLGAARCRGSLCSRQRRCCRTVRASAGEGEPEPLSGPAAAAAATEARRKRVTLFLRENENASFQDKPSSMFRLGARNFSAQFGGMLLEISKWLGLRRSDDTWGSLPETMGLQLSNERVSLREEFRENIAQIRAETSWPVRVGYELVCDFLDFAFKDRPIPRFWFLETVARMPYFSYVSVLHLWETLGWVRDPMLCSVHYAQQTNELHHLLIMEALGGDKQWFDRFLAQHAALVYYWLLVVAYMVWPAEAYRFSELLELHAVDTYSELIDKNREILASLPAPTIAETYYRDGPLYLFDEFQTSIDPGMRRPPVDTLLQVFEAIRDDELQHVDTMIACQDYCVKGKPVWSPNYREAVGTPQAESDLGSTEKSRIDDERREMWIKWAEGVNELENAKTKGL